MQRRAPLGEEVLELPVLDVGHHEEQEPDGEEQQAGEGVGGPDQEAVLRGGPEEALGGVGAVAEGVDGAGVEHHEGTAEERDQGVEHADHRERRRRRRGRGGRGPGGGGGGVAMTVVVAVLVAGLGGSDVGVVHFFSAVTSEALSG